MLPHPLSYGLYTCENVDNYGWPLIPNKLYMYMTMTMTCSQKLVYIML